MDKNHLKRLVVFSHVVIAGSFSAAARQLSLPRSSISEHIKLLEAGLGVRLLQRTTRTISLTPEGRVVFEKSQSIQALLREIEALAFDQTPSGKVTLSTTQDIAQFWLIPRLPEFYRLYPEIEVNLVVNDFISDLVHEQIDLAIRVTIMGKDSMLIGRELGNERMKLFASTEYLDQHGTPQSLQDLQHHRWIMFQQMTPQGVVVLRDASQQETLKPNRIYETNSPAIQRCMLEAGLGIGVHLPSLAQGSVKSGLLRPFMESWSSTAYSVHLVYPSRELPARTRALVEYLTTVDWNFM